MTSKELDEARNELIDFIVTRRKELGLNQADLAKKAGLGQATVERIEGKRFFPDGKSLLKICWALDCELNIRKR